MSAVEGDWEVSVQGRDRDLQYLARHFISPPTVIAESDSGQAYVLRLDAFSACKDSTEVLELAERQLVILSGILKLERNSPGAIQAGAVFRRRNGGRDVFVHVRDTIKVMVEMGEPVVTVTDAHGNLVSKPEVLAPAVSIAALCATDSSVEKVMRLFAAPDARTWVGLFRIYEVVESDTGGQANLARMAWGTANAQERFKHSANSVTVAGDDARHGKEHTEPPKNPMTLDEAGAYVEQLVRAWLGSKGI
jgi:hypothetical protein